MTGMKQLIFNVQSKEMNEMNGRIHNRIIYKKYCKITLTKKNDGAILYIDISTPCK